MNDVYGRLSPARLLPRERDALTGHLTARREDKRQDSDPSTQQPADQGLLGRSARVWWAAGVAAVVVAGSVAGAVAIAGRGGTASGRIVTAALPSTVPSLPTASVTGASAIQLDYTGGELTRHVCTSSIPGDTCLGDVDFGFDPLPVRCTATECTVYFFDGATAILGGPVAISGSYTNAPCPEVFWSLELTPIGDSVTEGIRHPARLVGRATAKRKAKNIVSKDCLSGDYEYRYDASPS